MTFNSTSNPNSKSYGNIDTCVSITATSARSRGDHVGAPCGQVQDQGDQGRRSTRRSRRKSEKEFKEKEKRRRSSRRRSSRRKSGKELKEKTRKRISKDRKEIYEKDLPDKRPDKPDTDKSVALDKPGDDKFVDTKLTDGRPPWTFDRPFGAARDPSALEARVAAIEAALFGQGEPFIGSDLRPDLSDSALTDEDDYRPSGPLADKRSYDAKPPEAR